MAAVDVGIKPNQSRNKIKFENLFNNNYYKKFFTISSRNGSHLAEINVIRANKQLQHTLKGKPEKVAELRDGSLLVEVANEQLSDHLHNLNALDEIEVTIKE